MVAVGAVPVVGGHLGQDAASLRSGARRRSDVHHADVVAFAAPHAAGGVAVALRDRIVHFDPARGAIATMLRVPLPDGCRLNDAVVDARGRLWIGSTAGAASADGALWRIDVDGSATVVVEGLITPNGLAIAPDDGTLYLSDSHPSVRSVFAFDFDVARGSLTRRRLFCSTERWPGRPDGACVDMRGNYWIAAVDGGCVLCIDAHARIADSVAVPVEKPSKPALGGHALDTLYVTSLRRHLARPLAEQPLAGGLFAAPVDARGLPVPPCSIALPRDAAT